MGRDKFAVLETTIKNEGPRMHFVQREKGENMIQNDQEQWRG